MIPMGKGGFRELVNRAGSAGTEARAVCRSGTLASGLAEWGQVRIRTEKRPGSQGEGSFDLS